ncbi:MAG TPA: SRPBCC domain-containing protein [Terriglobales bacterium]|nr:SRPBCC domain-containing protein [Terriglobales bacterium]
MPAIKHSIAIDAPPERIFPLLSSGEGFAQWWAEDITDVSPDSVELGFFNRQTIYRLRRVRAAAPTEVEWLVSSGKEWKDTRILFRLSSTKTGSQLQFSHADWRNETDYFVSCNTTWGELMFRLKAAAEGESPGPLFSTEGMRY